MIRRPLFLLLPLALLLGGCLDRELPTLVPPEGLPTFSFHGSGGPVAYVTNSASSSVSVISTSDNTVVATVGLGSGPYGIAVTPDGTRAYVANLFSHTVSVINTSANEVVATVAVGERPIAVAVTPDGTRAYVANSGSNSVSVISTRDNTVAASIEVGAAPRGVAITHDGARTYVANYESHNVSVINTADNSVVTTIAVGWYPVAVAITPARTPTFGGFLPPVDSEGLNVVKAGRAVPIQFSLGGDFGLNFFAAGYPKSVPIAKSGCTSEGEDVPTITVGQSGLSHDASADTYTYVWKTEKGWAGSCRQFQMQLRSGSTYTLDFNFTR